MALSQSECLVKLVKVKAIIFDFFGTLVDNFSSREHNRALSEIAKVLSTSEHDFVRM
jgi:beta-phosphoglucomutase-like phosphatase (HAD superfamily)